MIIVPVFYNLEWTRKRRAVSDTIRMRYSCFTCKKLYMGRIEHHYKKFPNHRRDYPLSETELSQSYSAIKARSDSSKPDVKAGEVSKPVLSPTPGTQASEANGEPSLPMETSALLLEGGGNKLQNSGAPSELMLSFKRQKLEESNLDPTQDFQPFHGIASRPDVLPQFEPSQAVAPNRRGRRGRGKGRRRGRGRWQKYPVQSPPVVEAPIITPEVAASPTDTLEQVRLYELYC